MTQRTPTAEEVLELFQKQREWPKHREGSYREIAAEFLVAYQQWHAAQGPYSFEWFCSRFGEYVHCNLGSLFAYIDGVELEIKGRHIFFDHPQRSDVEALVRLLSGKDGE